METHIGTHQVVGGHPLPLGHLPGPGRIAERLGGQGPHRTQVDHIAGQLGDHALRHIGADLHELAAAGGAQLPQAGDLLAETHATGAMDATGHVSAHQGADVLVLDDALFFLIAGHGVAVAQGQILEFALAPLIAYRAIQGVVDQQKLHHGALGLQGQPGAGANLHALRHRRGASRQGLGRLLHFHQAHAAVGGHAELGVVAEARHIDAGPVGGFYEHPPRLDLQGRAIHLYGHMVNRALSLRQCCAPRFRSCIQTRGGNA